MKGDTIVRKWIPPLVAYGRMLGPGKYVTVNVSACARRVREWFLCCGGANPIGDRELDNQFENFCGDEVQIEVLAMLRRDAAFAYMALGCGRPHCNAAMIHAAEACLAHPIPAPQPEEAMPLFGGAQ